MNVRQIATIVVNLVHSEPALTYHDCEEFMGYLKNCTDQQVYGVREKELAVGRKSYRTMAELELTLRGLPYEGKP